MRLRFNKNAIHDLQASDYFINTESLTNINPLLWFSKKQDLYIEIGSGRGNFIVNQALNNPNINFVAIEKNVTALAKILNKLKLHQITNLKIINHDAKKLDELFVHHCINKIYLNFSDPWPKARHAKRRLLHPSFLNVYYNLLVNNNMHIEFKTDNDSLFEYTYNDIIMFNPEFYQLHYVTTDLYNNLNEFNNSYNVATEYEKKFHALGKNIYKVVFSVLKLMDNNELKKY